MLFSMQEIQAILGLLNRTPMTPAEQLFTQGFFQRLVAFCQPSPPAPEPEPDESLRKTAPRPSTELTPDDAQALVDAMAIAEALDKVDAGESE